MGLIMKFLIVFVRPVFITITIRTIRIGITMRSLRKALLLVLRRSPRLVRSRATHEVRRTWHQGGGSSNTRHQERRGKLSSLVLFLGGKKIRNLSIFCRWGINRSVRHLTWRHLNNKTLQDHWYLLIYHYHFNRLENREMGKQYLFICIFGRLQSNDPKFYRGKGSIQVLRKHVRAPLTVNAHNAYEVRGEWASGEKKMIE